MFIFGIITGLISGIFSLFFTLLFLPLRLFGFAAGAGLMPVRLAFHFLFRHMFLCILIVLAVLIYLAFHNSKPAMPQLAPAPAENVAPKATGPVPVVQPVTKKENGDSSFATDLYASMTDPERAAYSRQFYWAMANLPDSQVYEWNFYNIAGAIRAIDTFENNEGVRCRHFTETLKVHAIQQSLSGSSCDQGNGSWCKLKVNATPACGLGAPSGGIFDGLLAPLKHLF